MAENGTDTTATAASGNGDQKRVIFHFGLRKTGSTSVQLLIWENARLFDPSFYMSPRLGITADLRRSALRYLRSGKAKHLDDYRDHARALADFVAGRAEQTFLFSDENFVGHSTIAPDGSTVFDHAALFLPILEQAFSAFQVDFVCYRRDLKKWLKSCYGQDVANGGELRSYQAWAADIPDSFDWESGLATIKSALKSPLHVISMEQEAATARFLGEGLLRLAGVADETCASLTVPAPQHEGLSDQNLNRIRLKNRVIKLVNAVGVLKLDTHHNRAVTRSFGGLQGRGEKWYS